MKAKLTQAIGPVLALAGVIVLTITHLLNDDLAVPVQVAAGLGTLALLIGSIVVIVQLLNSILPAWVSLLLVSIPFFTWMIMIDDLGAIVPGNIGGILVVLSVVAFAFKRSHRNHQNSTRK